MICLNAVLNEVCLTIERGDRCEREEKVSFVCWIKMKLRL